MERLDCGREVINLGDTGYNLPEQVEPIRRWTLRTRHVVYLFRDTDLDGAVRQLIVDGYRSRRLRQPDGTNYGDEKMGPATARRIAEVRRSRRLRCRSLLPPCVRGALWRALKPEHADPRSDAGERAAAVTHGVDATEQMRVLAEEREMSFYLAIASSLREVKERSYTWAVVGYASDLETRGFAPIRLLDDLSVGLYCRHDGHLNPASAQAVAHAVDATFNGERP